MRKLCIIAFAVLFVYGTVITSTASSAAVLFNDFENSSTFVEGEDIVDKPDVKPEAYKNYNANTYDSSPAASAAKLSIVSAKGEGASKALSISQTRGDSNSNVAVQLYTATPVAIKGAKYLVVWVDFTGVDFRKACFGVIGENHTLYRTDELDGKADLKFFVQDGDNWTEKLHGGDGCFGAAQDSSLKDYKGYAAFPIADFVSWDSSDLAFDPETQKVTGVYMYFDYNGAEYSEKAFYLDNINFIADYKDIVKPVENESSETSSKTDTPSTGDTLIPVAIVASVSLAGVVIIARKRRTV